MAATTTMLSADAPEFKFSAMNATAVEFVPANNSWQQDQVVSSLSADAPEFTWNSPAETAQDASYGGNNYLTAYLNLDQYSDDSSSSEEDSSAATKAAASKNQIAAKLLPGLAASPAGSTCEPAAEPGLEGEASKTPSKTKISKDKKANVVKEISDPEVPHPWYKKESSKYPGRFYYVNKETGATTWKKADIKVELAKKEESDKEESEPEAEAAVTADRSPVAPTVRSETHFALTDLMRWRHAPAGAPCSTIILPSAQVEATSATSPRSDTTPAWRAAQVTPKADSGSNWRLRASAGSDSSTSAGESSGKSTPSTPDRMQVSQTSFAAQMRARRAAFGGATGSSMSPEAAAEAQVARSVKSLLNKLTVEKFPSISRQLCEIKYESASHVKILIKEIFEKATTQHTYIEMYADLCELLHEYFLEHPVSQDPKCVFKRLLLNECQLSFERNLAPPTDLEKLDEEERTVAEVRYKTRMLGNIRFVGALLSRRMLASKVLIAILKELMADPTPEALETVAALLTVTGPTFDTCDWTHADELNVIFAQVQEICNSRNCNSRARCLLQDVLDLRATDWEDNKPARKEGPMKLQEVADKAREENAGRNSPTSYSSRNSSWYSYDNDNSYASWSQARW